MQERLIAWAEGYRVLAACFLNGLTAETHAALEAAGLWVAGEPFDAPAAAARHQEVLGFDIPPYASVFRSSSGMLGGVVEQGVRARYHQAGFALQGAAIDTPDHIGALFQFLARQCAAPHQAPALLTRAFIEEEVWSWLPVLTAALARTDAALYASLARIGLELTVAHAASLPSTSSSSPVALPEAPPLTLQPEKGFMAVAKRLTRPALAGVYFSRTDLRRIGAAHRLPMGFGDRTRILANLLQSAYRFDQLPATFARMAAIIDEQDQMLAALHDALPVLTAAIAPWITRGQNTVQQLTRLAG